MGFRSYMILVALDYETFYSSTYSIDDLGGYHYVNHPQFDPYLISIYCPEWHYVGPPQDFDWAKLGDDWEAVAHNSSFDSLVHAKAFEMGLVKSIPKKWHCSANLCAYLAGTRSLKDAVNLFFHANINKEVRKEAKGKTWADFQEKDRLYEEYDAKIKSQEKPLTEKQLIFWGKKRDKLLTTKRMKEYAFNDAKYCYELWTRNQALWPEWERRLADITMRQGRYGVKIDLPLLEKYLVKVERYNELARLRIPWRDTHKLLSMNAVIEQCQKEGIKPPPSLDENDEWAQKWEAEHIRFKWVRAMRSYRKTRTLIKKLNRMKTRQKPDGRMAFEMFYAGTSTRRWAGAGGFNMQNLTKGRSYGVDLRRSLISEEGKKFIIADLAQIEARITLLTVRDDVALAQIRRGISVYHAHAISSMGWTGGDLKQEDKKKYALAKARILALGYGAGWKKFITMVRQYGITPEELFLKDFNSQTKTNFLIWLSKWDKVFYKTWKDEPEFKQKIAINAWEEVVKFRESNPKIMGYHKKLDDEFKACVGGNYELTLPSGNSLLYRDVQANGRDYTAFIGGERRHFYGGKLFENYVQAVARDVFAYIMLRLIDHKVPVIFHAHDEDIIEVKTNISSKPVEELITQSIPWLPDLPIGTEVKESNFYLK